MHLPLLLPTTQNEVKETCWEIEGCEILPDLAALGPHGGAPSDPWLLLGEGWRNNPIIIIYSKGFFSGLIFTRSHSPAMLTFPPTSLPGKAIPSHPITSLPGGSCVQLDAC